MNWELSIDNVGVAMVVGVGREVRTAVAVAVGMGVGEARGEGRSVEPPADWGTGRLPTITCWPNCKTLSVVRPLSVNSSSRVKS